MNGGHETYSLWATKLWYEKVYITNCVGLKSTTACSQSLWVQSLVDIYCMSLIYSKKIMSPSEPESNRTLRTTLLLDTSGLVDLSWDIAAVAVVIPCPFTILQREVEYIILVGLTTLIGRVLMLFALISLFLREVTMFLSLDELVFLLLQSCPEVQSESDESEEE